MSLKAFQNAGGRIRGWQRRGSKKSPETSDRNHSAKFHRRLASLERRSNIKTETLVKEKAETFVVVVEKGAIFFLPTKENAKLALLFSLYFFPSLLLHLPSYSRKAVEGASRNAYIYTIKRKQSSVEISILDRWPSTPTPWCALKLHPLRSLSSIFYKA